MFSFFFFNDTATTEIYTLSLHDALPISSTEWAAERERLMRLLTTEEYESARASTLNAHYTSATVISAIYDAVQRLGFEHGRVLEPAMGIGHFFGLMPAEIQARSQLTGVEIDPLTASIAR